MSLAWYVAAIASLVALAAAVAMARAASDRDRAKAQLAGARRENDRLREAFAGISGWTPEGRLPDDWAEIVRSRLSQAGSPADAAARAEGDALAAAARDALLAVPAPMEAAGDRRDEVRRTHERAAELFDSLARTPRPLAPALANGDLDDMVGLWLRLDSYCPGAEAAAAYMLAVAVLLARLGDEGIRIHVSRPLTTVGHAEADFTTDDRDGLRGNAAIRGKANAFAGRTATGAERIVVDCIAPGWSGAAGGRRARLLVWDRTWQD